MHCSTASIVIACAFDDISETDASQELSSLVCVVMILVP